MRRQSQDSRQMKLGLPESSDIQCLREENRRLNTENERLRTQTTTLRERASAKHVQLWKVLRCRCERIRNFNYKLPAYLVVLLLWDAIFYHVRIYGRLCPKVLKYATALTHF